MNLNLCEAGKYASYSSPNITYSTWGKSG